MRDRVSRIEVGTSRISSGNFNVLFRLLDNLSQPGVSKCHKYCKTKSYVLPLSCDRNAYGTFCQICQLFYTARTETAQSVRRLRYGTDSRRVVVGFRAKVRDVSFIQSFETGSGGPLTLIFSEYPGVRHLMPRLKISGATSLLPPYNVIACAETASHCAVSRIVVIVLHAQCVYRLCTTVKCVTAVD
jgi:hypothetical protein